jgi:endonuclease G
VPWRGDHPIDVVRRALLRAKRFARGLPGVRGVDYGVVQVDGEPTDRLGIRFHVPLKIPTRALRAAEVLPPSVLTIPCDVIVAAYGLHANEDPRATIRPVRPGSSVGSVPHRKAGTIGCFVRTRTEGQIAILSNWHVLFGGTDAALGDDVSQPSVRFATDPTAGSVARLSRDAGLDTGYDAAIAVLEPGLASDPRILGIDRPPGEVLGVEPRMRLQKFGVTSGLTHGVVDGVLGSYEMDYTGYGDQRRWMDAFRIVPDPESEPAETEISLGGDSGAVWVERGSSRAVGLHFAGEDGLGPTGEYALAHPLGRTLDLLRADLFV